MVENKPNQKLACPHPTVHKDWVKTLLFCTSFFMHRYLDKYTADLAININRYIEIKDVTFNHLKLII